MLLTCYGVYKALDIAFRGASATDWSQFNAVLVTAAAAPDEDSELFSAFTEIAAGAGYSAGGITVEASSVGWPVLTQNDAGSPSRTIMVHKTLSFAFSAAWPASGSAARYCLILDNAATKRVIGYEDLGSARSDTVASTLTIGDGSTNGSVRIRQA